MINVSYVSSYQDYSGYGEAARNFIAALYVVGINLTVESVKHVPETSSYGWIGALAGNHENRQIDAPIRIIHLTPDCYDRYKEEKKYHIGHLFWETNKIPKEWVHPCNEMDEIWTASEKSAEMLRSSGVKTPIYWFPQPIDISLAETSFPAYQIRGHKGFLFYSIFQWIERKNPKTLLHAFWRAFEGKDDVSLLIKTHRLNYTDQEYEKIRDDIQAWKRELTLSHYPRVYFYPQMMSRSEIIRLHQTGDCFVLPHHGEGWCRPIQEALLHGNRVIGTNAGGIHDYLTDEHYYPLAPSLSPVVEQEWIPYYTGDQRWWNVDEDEVIKQLKSVYRGRKQVDKKALAGKKFIRSSFNYWRVGAMMRKRLEAIHKKL